MKCTAKATLALLILALVCPLASVQAGVATKGLMAVSQGSPGGGLAVYDFSIVGQGRELGVFQPYGPLYKGGIRTAIGDITGDGIPDLVLVPAEKSPMPVLMVVVGVQITPDAPTIFVFEDGVIFFPFGEGYNKGMNVALGQLDANTTANEIIIGTENAQQNLVRTFSFDNDTSTITQLPPPIGEFMPFGLGVKTGVRLDSIGIDPSGIDKIVCATGTGVDSLVRILNNDATEFTSFAPFPPGFRGGVSVAATTRTLVVGPGKGAPPVATVYDVSTTGVVTFVQDLTVYNPRYRGGIRLGIFLGGAGLVVGPGGSAALPVEIFVPSILGDPQFLSSSPILFGGFFPFGPRSTRPLEPNK